MDNLKKDQIQIQIQIQYYVTSKIEHIFYKNWNCIFKFFSLVRTQQQTQLGQPPYSTTNAFPITITKN